MAKVKDKDAKTNAIVIFWSILTVLLIGLLAFLIIVFL